MPCSEKAPRRCHQGPHETRGHGHCSHRPGPPPAQLNLTHSRLSFLRDVHSHHTLVMVMGSALKALALGHIADISFLPSLQKAVPLHWHRRDFTPQWSGAVPLKALAHWHGTHYRVSSHCHSPRGWRTDLQEDRSGPWRVAGEHLAPGTAGAGPECSSPPEWRCPPP